MGRIHIAACQGDFQEVKELLAEKPQLLNTLDNDFNTPLVSATIFGHLNIVKYIIENFGEIYMHYRYYPNGPLISTFRETTEENSIPERSINSSNTSENKDETTGNFHGRIKSGGGTTSIQMQAFHFHTNEYLTIAHTSYDNYTNDCVTDSKFVEDSVKKVGKSIFKQPEEKNLRDENEIVGVKMEHRVEEHKEKNGEIIKKELSAKSEQTLPTYLREGNQ